jgi:[ribosomal protein S18]-alanine N-acetyltransferase
MFLGELGNPTVCAIFGAFGANRDLLGYCSVWFVADELHINHIGVAPVHRRRGIARRLLVAAINDAVALGASHATLEVRISNHAARRLYEGFGFQMRAIRPRYYDHPVEDALIFWHENLAVALGPQPDPAA